MCAGELTETLRLAPDLAARARLHEGSDNRRREPRFTTDEEVVVRLLNPFSASRTDARILNVSRHGLMLQLEANLYIGSTVQIRMKDTILLGEVRHCNQAGRAFHVGIVIRNVFPISQRRE